MRIIAVYQDTNGKIANVKLEHVKVVLELFCNWLLVAIAIEFNLPHECKMLLQLRFLLINKLIVFMQ